MIAIKFPVVAAALAFFSMQPAMAQTANYRGSYYFGVVYTVGEAAGLGSHGGATVARSGQAVFTEYFPSTGQSFTATGRVDRIGRISFTESFLAGGGRIHISANGLRRLGNGTFGNPYSGGSFFVVR